MDPIRETTMRIKATSALVFAASLSFVANAAQTDVAGPGYTPVDQDHAMLELLDGKASAASVTDTLYDAVMGARDVAWTERHKMIQVPSTLQRHALGKSGKALVTIGEPSPAVKAVLAQSR